MAMKVARVCTVLASLVSAGCADKAATQIFIGLATDLDAPKPLQQISMKIERSVGPGNDYVEIDDGDLTTKWLIKGLPDNQYELPSSVVAFSEGGEPKIRVTVFAENSGGRFIARRAVMRLVREKTLFMRIGITQRCVDNADCPDDKTCIEGRCRSPDVESKELPLYDQIKRPELSFECDSGTPFRNTTTGAVLVTTAATCPSTDQVCVEGTCYRKEVFGTSTLTQPQTIEVQAQVTDPAGLAVNGAEFRLEDGPVSIVRKLRTQDSLGFAMPPPSVATVMGDGRYQLESRTESMTSDVRLTVAAPGKAPQVVSVPVKAGVSRYFVPVVLFPMVEQTVAASGPRSVMLRVGERTATLELGASTEDVRLRYALIDNRFVPGLAVPPDGSGLLQSVAAVYLENAGQAGFPTGTNVTLGTASTAPVEGTEGEAGGYVLDLQGRWKKRLEAVEEARPDRLRPLSGGFWTVANHTPKPACVRGRILRAAGSCAGARVRLWGPEGVSSFDSVGADGSFCGAAAQGEAAILAVGSSTRAIYVPATSRVGAQCGLPDTCADIGDVMMNADDCDRPPLESAGSRPPGDACKKTNECAGLASCYRDFCVTESYARVSVVWGARSDFDLHVKLPDGRTLYERSRELKDVGRLDVEQCAKQCLGDQHLENIVLSGKAPTGTYEAWVENFGGAAGGPAEVEVLVAGTRKVMKTVTVPATADGKSESVTFTLP
jgi:hypothetical protein